MRIESPGILKTVECSGRAWCVLGVRCQAIKQKTIPGNPSGWCRNFGAVVPIHADCGPDAVAARGTNALKSP